MRAAFGRIKILGSNMFGPNNLLLKQDELLLAGIGVLGLYPRRDF